MPLTEEERSVVGEENQHRYFIQNLQEQCPVKSAEKF